MNEQELQALARKMTYPPAPEIQLPQPLYSKMHRWRWAIVLLILIMLVVVIEPARAVVVEVLEIGGIRIEIGEQDTTSAPRLVLVGETTLADAQHAIDFTLKYPEPLDLPVRVYRQDGLVVLRWDKVALYQFRAHRLVKATPIIEYVPVEGSDIAAWIETPHLLWFTVGGDQQRQLAYLVEGNVLLWEREGITYRLESNLPQETMIDLAESLIDIP